MEIRELYEESDVSVEDHLTMHERITESKGSFLPDDLPFLFLYMDSDLMFENSLKTLYSEDITVYSGRNFLDKLNREAK